MSHLHWETSIHYTSIPGSRRYCLLLIRLNFVYYESRKGEVKPRPIYECRYDDRLKMKSEKPKDTDEVNRRDVCECDGWACVLEVIGVSSRLSVIRKVWTLTRVLSTFSFRVVKNTVRWKWNSPLVDYGNWIPETTKKRSVSRWTYRNNSLINTLCNLPDVLVIGSIKETVWGGLFEVTVCLLLIDKARVKTLNLFIMNR
jgi:hypothetical protein